MSREKTPTSEFVVEVATGGPAQTNGYLIADPVSRRAVMIDAPYEATEELLDRLRRGGGTWNGSS